MVAEESVMVEEVTPASKKKAPKAPKEKKRPSDFEIFKTLMQRISERKLPYLLKRIGEDPDVLFLCSADESCFTYGSPDISIMILEILDGDLKANVQSFLDKLYGFHLDEPKPCFINIRDQISALNKNKGKELEIEATCDPFGSAWIQKSDINGNERVVYFSKAIDSLFHVQLVKHWCETYRPLLAGLQNEHIRHNYTHTHPDNCSTLSIPQTDDPDHPLGKLYPAGLRLRVTRGIDVIIDKFVHDLPHPIVSQDLIMFRADVDAAACQVAHRIVTEHWRAVILRPNAVFIPTPTTPLAHTESFSL